MSNEFILPDKTWSKEELDQFINEHNINDAKGEKNHFKKIGIIKKWAEKNIEAVDSVDDNQEDSKDETPTTPSVKMNDTYFDLDRSRTFIEFEVIARSRNDAFEFIDKKEKAIIKKFDIRKPNGDSDMETMSHVINDQVVRVSVTIPTKYMQQIVREGIVNA